MRRRGGREGGKLGKYANSHVSNDMVGVSCSFL